MSENGDKIYSSSVKCDIKNREKQKLEAENNFSDINTNT